MPITISGDGTIAGIATGGYPAATVNVEDLNAGTASAGQVLVAGGATGAMTFGSSIVLGTPQNSTSGTSIDFTGIPSWARRITITFLAVSTNGTSDFIVRLGSGSFATTGYSGTMWTSTASTQRTDGFPIFSPINAANNAVGFIQLVLSGSNIWHQSGNLAYGNTQSTGWSSAGALQTSLSGALDRIRITTVNGTDTFDLGSINIMWE